MTELTTKKRKRHRLSKMTYDEVSLVDVGANQHAHVVLAKAYEPYSAEPGAAIKPQGLSAKQRKTLEDDAVKQAQAARDKKRKAADKAEKESQRAQNWEESRHKRKAAGSPAGGEFDTTSSESKQKYGRGGTTQEKLDRLERRKQMLLNRKNREDAALATEKTKAGDTLWQMAVNHYGDGRKWKLIANANGITDPKKLPVGVVLKIPKDPSKKDGDSGSSSTTSRRRRSTSSASSSDDEEAKTREERLAQLKAKKRELERLLEDVNSETSIRSGDLNPVAGVTVRTDGTVVHKIHPRRLRGGVT